MRIGIQGSTSPVVTVSRIVRGVGENLAARLVKLQDPGRAASRTRHDRGWKSKCSGSKDDDRKEGDRNHDE